MDSFFQDVKFGIRMLLKNRGFTVVAVLTLALGIGANTAIFSLVRAVLLRPLPLSEPDRIAAIWERRSTSRFTKIPVSGHEFAAWRDQSQTLERIALYDFTRLHLTGAGEPEQVQGNAVSADFFGVLGVSPALGRAFLPGEDARGAKPVAVLSDRLWRRRFGASPSIVGQHIRLNDRDYEVVGVMPPLPESLSSDLWFTLDLPAELQRVGRHSLMTVARLKPGVDFAQAQADLGLISQRLERERPEFNTDHSVQIAPLREDMTGNLRRALAVLSASVGFVLLIACVNVANLLLARSAGRRRELAIRSALGASRLRLARQLLTESMCLAALGGGLGVLLAYWLADVFPRIRAINIPLVETTSIDTPVLLLTLGLVLFAGLLSGLAPALRSSRAPLTQTLNEGARMSADPGQRRLGGFLVASEVALALMLLVGAGLMIRSFARLASVDAGFDPAQAAAIPLELPGARYAQAPQRLAFYRELEQRIAALPGVEAVGGTTTLPLGGGDNWMPISIEGRPPAPRGQEPAVKACVVTTDYFRAMRIPLRRGRFFARTDARSSVPMIRWYPQQPMPPDSDKPQPAPVVIISEAMARQFWPDEDPVGKQLRVLLSPPLTIVGVVADVKHNALTAPAYPQLYMLHSQEPWDDVTMVVRTSGRPLDSAAALRAQVRAIDPQLPVNVLAMEEVFADSIGQQRFYALLVGIFSALALSLAMVGIFGVVSHSAARRTTEIGVRMALGAQPRHILALITREGMLPALAGVGAGLAGSLLLTRSLEKLLFETKPTDPLTLVGVCLLMAAVATLACVIPARRATRVDPMVALRSE